MKATKIILIALAVGLATAGRAAAQLNVVTTVPGLAAITKELGGARVIVKSLSRASQDPHFVDPKPSLALDLNRAQLLVVNGLDLEIGWLPTLMVGARNGRIQVGSPGYLDCGQLVQPVEVPPANADRSMGDIHRGGNPHYLFDPRQAVPVARGIAARLAALDPAHKAEYEANAKAFIARLETARAGWEKRLAAYKGTPVVAYHNSWTYLANWLHLPQVGFLEPKPGIPPNPRHVAQLLAIARQRGVRLVLQESHHPDTTSKILANKLGAAHVEFPADADFHAGESYLQYVERLVSALERGLGGKAAAR